MIKIKKAMSNWIWVLIVLGVFALGGIIYLVVGGGSIPQPPALPN